jgi:hypothetical protein
VLNAFSRAVWIESATGVAIAATRVEGMDNQKQLPLAEAITEDLKMVSDTITENTGGAGSSQSGRDDVDSLANAPQGSDVDQMGVGTMVAKLAIWLQACNELSVNLLDMKLASDADVLGMRLMAAFVGGEHLSRMMLISVKQFPVREVWP